jgi:S1-C subfamily serine protease
MRFRAKLVQFKAAFLTVGVILGLSIGSTAWGDSTGDLVEITKKVESAIVFIENGKDSTGSGFVVDARGVIATNMHVIDGAKELTVSFPSNKDKKKYKAEGFIEVLRGKDMALIVIKSDDGKPFPVLKIADKKPEQGEWVAAFGAPLGLTSTASAGNVSSLRTGKEFIESGQEMQIQLYKSLGYDSEAEWIQITAPISPGNSGGPLINARGEVVGINTWQIPTSIAGAQALNFSVSTKHLKEFIAHVGSIVKPLSSLPPPSFHHGGGGGGGPDGPHGDPEKTLALWKQFNKALNELNEKIADCDSKLEKIPALDPRNAASAQNKRNKKVSDVFRKYSSAYKEHAGKVRELQNDKAETKLIELILMDATLSEMLSATYQKVATAVLTQGGSRENEFHAVDLKKPVTELRTQYDVLRHNLGVLYRMTFPSVEETANDPGSDAGEETAKTDEKKNGKASSSADSAKRSELREWSDASGKYKIKAKCLGVEDGKVKLEKTDGAVISVPISSLSEADREFLEESK